MGILESIESTAFATWVRESPSIFAYTGVLSLHAIGLAIVVGTNTVVALRVLGVARSIPLEPLDKLFPLMYTGFAINAVSGLALLAANATGMLTNVLFLFKLGFIACAVVTMQGLRTHVFATAGASAVLMPPRARTLALLSIVFWAAALVAGRLTAYPNFVRSLLGL
jgi:hypothetical protein